MIFLDQHEVGQLPWSIGPSSRSSLITRAAS
jgi:hypothetical protein